MDMSQTRVRRAPYWVPAITAGVAIVAFIADLDVIVLLAALSSSWQVYTSIRHIDRTGGSK